MTLAPEDPLASRVVVWFSCGSSSAVAAKLAVDKYPDRAVIVYCDTMVNEHPDNQRFLKDVELWIDRKIERISNGTTAVEDIFEKRKYMSGPKGAPCTVALKKIPRFNFQLPDDIHVFGYTSDEVKRIRSFEQNNPELNLEWMLRDRGYTKTACHSILRLAKIPLPAMYGMQYNHNNCLGCVKATSPMYWNSIRRDFPEVWQRRAEQSRRLGVRLVRYRGKRIFLDELKPDIYEGRQEVLSCGPECGEVGS